MWINARCDRLDRCNVMERKEGLSLWGKYRKKNGKKRVKTTSIVSHWQFLSSACPTSTQQRGGFCSGNDSGEPGSDQKGAVHLCPHSTGDLWSALSPAVSVALARSSHGQFYTTGGGPAQSSALIWLDKAPCRQSCCSAPLLSLGRFAELSVWHSSVCPCSLPNGCCGWDRLPLPQGQPWAWEPHSSPLLIPPVLLPSPAGKPETQKWGSAKSVLCHRSVSNAVNRAAKLHWSSRQAQKKEWCVYVCFVCLGFFPFFRNANLQSIRYIE